MNFWRCIMDRLEIGKKIKQLRESRDWKKGTLATKAGVSPGYIYDLEKGIKCPTVETLDAICFAFGITLEDFFSEKKEDTLADRVSSLTNKQKDLLNDFLNSL